MRRFLVLGLTLALVMPVGAVLGGTIEWYNVPGTYIYQHNSAVLRALDGWAVALYDIGDLSTPLQTTTTDQVSWGEPDAFYSSYSEGGAIGRTVVIRLYNNSVIGNATYYTEGNIGQVVISQTLPGDTDSIDFGGFGPSAAWTPVPEPSTIMLLAMGLLTAAAWRRRRQV